MDAEGNRDAEKQVRGLPNFPPLPRLRRSLTLEWNTWLQVRPRWMEETGAQHGFSEQLWWKIRTGLREVRPGELARIADRLKRPLMNVTMEYEMWWSFRPPADTRTRVARSRHDAARITEELLRQSNERAVSGAGGEGTERLEPATAWETVGPYPAADRLIGAGEGH